jgi:diacylglycerol kinase
MPSQPSQPSQMSDHGPNAGKRSWIVKFRDTFRGLGFAVQEQSFRVHVFFALAVLIATTRLGASKTEWLFLVAAIGSVLITETINTAIERLARAVTKEENPLVGQALDLASAAVLIASFFAVIVGLVILGPKCLALLSG